MATIIRSVHNALTVDVFLTHTNVVIPASTTVDLFTLISDDELLQVQEDLVKMVASGTLTVVTSDDKSEVLAGGFDVKHVSTTEKDAISSPKEGTVVYDTTLHKLCVYTAQAGGSSTGWETITSVLE